MSTSLSPWYTVECGKCDSDMGGTDNWREALKRSERHETHSGHLARVYEDGSIAA